MNQRWSCMDGGRWLKGGRDASEADRQTDTVRGQPTRTGALHWQSFSFSFLTLISCSACFCPSVLLRAEQCIQNTRTRPTLSLSSNEKLRTAEDDRSTRSSRDSFCTNGRPERERRESSNAPRHDSFVLLLCWFQKSVCCGYALALKWPPSFQSSAVFSASNRVGSDACVLPKGGASGLLSSELKMDPKEDFSCALFGAAACMLSPSPRHAQHAHPRASCCLHARCFFLGVTGLDPRITMASPCSKGEARTRLSEERSVLWSFDSADHPLSSLWVLLASRLRERRIRMTFDRPMAQL